MFSRIICHLQHYVVSVFCHAYLGFFHVLFPSICCSKMLQEINAYRRASSRYCFHSLGISIVNCCCCLGILGLAGTLESLCIRPFICCCRFSGAVLARALLYPPP